MLTILENEPIYKGKFTLSDQSSFEIYAFDKSLSSKSIQEEKAIFISGKSVSFCVIKQGISVIWIQVFQSPGVGGLEFIFDVPQGENGFDQKILLSGEVKALATGHTIGNATVKREKSD